MKDAILKTVEQLEFEKLFCSLETLSPGDLYCHMVATYYGPKIEICTFLSLNENSNSFNKSCKEVAYLDSFGSKSRRMYSVSGIRFCMKGDRDIVYSLKDNILNTGFPVLV